MDLLEERCMRELDKDFQDYLDKHYGNSRKFNLKTIQYSEVPVGGLFLYKVVHGDVYILLRKRGDLSGVVIWESRGYIFSKGETMPFYSKVPVAYMGVILKGEKR